MSGSGKSQFRDVLAIRPFRKVWFVGLIAAIGDQIFPICATILLINQGEGATGISILMSVRAIAFISIAPIGGVWVDRLPKNKVIVFGAIVRAMLCVGVFMLGDEASLISLAFFVLIMGVTEGFSGPAGRAILPNLLDHELLQTANALGAMTGRIASISGPGIAALIAAIIEPRYGFLLTAAGFLFAAFHLLDLPRATSNQERQSFVSEIRGGLTYIKQTRWMLVTMVILALQVSILFGAEMVLLPVITNDVFETTKIYPIAIASLSAGSLVSAYFAARINVENRGRISFLSWIFLSALLIGLIFPINVPFLLTCYFIGGIATQPMGVFWATALQREVPVELRGRVMSLDSTLTSALVPFGMMLAGPMSEAVGERTYLASSLILFLILSVIALITPGVARFSSSR